MERVEEILMLINDALDTGHKRHIIGGILMSVSLLFAGLSMTVISLNKDEDDDNGRIN